MIWLKSALVGGIALFTFFFLTTVFFMVKLNWVTFAIAAALFVGGFAWEYRRMSV